MMVRFTNFQDLDPAAREIVAALMANAYKQQSAFMSFVNIWMGFNGWMAAVTERDIDADMIRNLINNQRLISAYDELMVTNPRFRRLVSAFTNMWPVFSVRDIRKKLGRGAVWQYKKRNELITACIAAGVKQQPVTWAVGKVPTWEQVLW